MNFKEKYGSKIWGYLCRTSFVYIIFQNDSSFNLKQYLLGLKEKLGFELNGYFLL
ncbi:hypothetical protein HpCHC45_10470 [Helicobacter pylori]